MNKLFETPEHKEDNEAVNFLWSEVYAATLKESGSHSKAAKDADKAVKAYKERFK